jgi:hypothetical protein
MPLVTAAAALISKQSKLMLIGTDVLSLYCNQESIIKMIIEQINIKKRKSISEVLAIVAMTLLTIDTVNTFTSQGGNGFCI